MDWGSVFCPPPAFLRIGEVTVNGKDHNNLVRLPQLTILQYKHSNNGRPFMIYIHKEVSCLVKAILDYVSTRGSFNGPLFCWLDGAPITRSFFVEQLNRALRVCNLDPALYKSHSFRIGAAT